MSIKGIHFAMRSVLLSWNSWVLPTRWRSMTISGAMESSSYIDDGEGPP
jgi:hypothetical protein